jgi:hypothetical protein
MSNRSISARQDPRSTSSSSSACSATPRSMPTMTVASPYGSTVRDAGWFSRVRLAISIGTPEYPVPRALTIAGCILSAVALLGILLDWRGFVVNVAAGVVLIGPALIISNVVVKAVHEARARRRITPLTQMTSAELFKALWTAWHALEMVEDAKPLVVSKAL